MALSPILDVSGLPIQKLDPAALTQEIAAPGLTSIRQIYPDTYASGMTPERMAAFLDAAAKNSIRDYLTIAEEMEERDPHYFAELGKRKLAIQGVTVSVEAASESAKDVEIADATREMMELECVDGSQADLLDGLGKGFSVSEIVWDTSEKQFQPKEILHRDPRWFRFDIVDRTTVRLLDVKDPAYGLILPLYKFLVHKPKLKTGIPIRGGLARIIAFMWICKAYAQRDWMAFAEVFGMPLRVGRYPATATPKDVVILKRAVANIGTDAAAVLPESMKIEFQELSNTAGAAELYEKLCVWLDGQTSKAVLGQTMSADAKASGMGSGNAALHGEVRQDILEADCKQLGRTYTRDLVKPFVDLNYGPQRRYPQVVIADPEQEDVSLLVKSVATLVPLGLRVGAKVMREKIGIPEPAADDELLVAPALPEPDPEEEQDPEQTPGARALNRSTRVRTRSQKQTVKDQVTLTQNADKLSDPVLIKDRIDGLQALLDNSGDFEGFSSGLKQLAGESASEVFVEALARAGFAAHLSGRTPGG